MCDRRINLTPGQAADLQDAVEQIVQDGIQPPQQSRETTEMGGEGVRWVFDEGPTPLPAQPLRTGDLILLRGQNPFIGVFFFVRARILEIDGDAITGIVIAVWDETGRGLGGTTFTNLGFGEPALNEVIRFFVRQIQARQAENSLEMGSS